MKKLLLIDGSALMFRAYYATAYTGNLMKNSKGLHTNAIFGFANMMEKVLKMDFTHIFVAFDKGKKTFRHEKLESYKDGRSKMPDEMREQLSYMKEYVTKLGIKQDEIELIEADDIIGTLTTDYKEQFDEINVITGDKDLLQLINDKVTVSITRRGVSELEKYDAKYLMEKMSVTPEQMIDLKGLMGDASDNLKGIPGVGEKTAIKLLKQYETLENVISDMENIKGKLGEKIRDNFESAILCKEVATIKCDVELDFGMKELKFEGINKEELLEFYKEVEFKSFAKKLEVNKKPSVEVNYKKIENEFDLKDILVDNSTIILESYGYNYHKSEPLGFALTNEKGNFFVPFDFIHTSIDLQMFLEDESLSKDTFNAKEMRVILLKEGFNIKGIKFDLMIANYVLKPKLGKEEFRTIVESYDYDNVMYEEAIYGKGAKYKIPEEVKYELHAVKKAIAIRELKEDIIEDLKKNNQLSLYENIEHPLSEIISDMEFVGIKVDTNLLEEYREEFQNRIDKLEIKIYEIAGIEFNISSPKQLGEILFERLNLPIIKKTKTGYSTGVEVLNKLRDKHEIINFITEYRKIKKLMSTYIEGLNTELINGVAHTIYKQTLTETGRLSSVSPNLQNIPVRTEEGRLIRKLFVPKKSENIFMAADYSQVELRILAHISQTESLIKAFKDQEDIHSKTAKDVFMVDEVTSDLRRKAKAVNFGIIYGMSAYGLSEDVDMNPAEAKRFIDKYLATYPGIDQYMKDTVESAKDKGYVETLYNRRRYIPEMNSSVYMQREMGKRLSMNAPIQGTAADIIKKAMVDIHKEMKKRKLKSELILQVHDELIFEVVKEEQVIMKELIKTYMEGAASLDVPLTVDVIEGNSWFELK